MALEGSALVASLQSWLQCLALIRRLASQFPGYGLERHAGYGTKQHREALLASGPTRLHRRTFLRRLLG